MNYGKNEVAKKAAEVQFKSPERSHHKLVLWLVKLVLVLFTVGISTFCEPGLRYL